MIRLAFQIAGHDGWMGGRVHLGALIHALKRTYRNGVHVSLVAPKMTKELKAFALQTCCDDVVMHRRAGKARAASLLEKFIAPFARSKHPESKEALFSKRGVDLFFGNLLGEESLAVPTMSWFPDFQHKVMSEMFSEEECIERDRVFRRSAERSSRIIMMSEASRKDLETHMSDYAFKARVIKTTSLIPERVYAEDPLRTAGRYALPEKFVYLPNQLWKHKNHERFLAAVRILRDGGRKISVVLSGATLDYRHPDYFETLKGRISDWGIGSQVHVLGMIPRRDVFQLMRRSAVVVNPSLYEGFGLSADEALNLGKRTLLSDIPVFRERLMPGAEYFNPYDADQMALALDRVYRSAEPGPDMAAEYRFKSNYPARLRESAESLMSVAKELLQPEWLKTGVTV